jgi:hypothetical protein
MKKLYLLLLLLSASHFSVTAQSDYKKLEISGGYVVNKTETERFGDFSSFAGIPASEIPDNFQATRSELEEGFKDAFGGAKYLNGINLSGSYYLNKNFAVIADFSFAAKKSNRQISDNPIFFENIAQTRRTRSTLLGGVQWKSRKKRVEPFVRLMGGIVRSKNRTILSVSGQSNSSADEESFRLEDDYTAFALSAGGGVDIRINKSFAVRVIQFDYIPTFPGNRTADLTAPASGSPTRVDLGLTRLDNSLKNNFRFGFGIVFNY